MDVPYLEIVLFLFFAYFFYTKEKPKKIYFILGAFFAALSIALQLPILIMEPYLEGYITQAAVSTIIVMIASLVIMEIVKYFSLKRYLKTRSYKNGIFFGIGWVGMISIPYFSFIVYDLVLSYLSIPYHPQELIETTLPLWSFIFFFVINLAITVLVIFSVINKTKIYLIYALIFSILVNTTLYETGGDIILQIVYFLFSLLIIFRYRLFG